MVKHSLSVATALITLTSTAQSVAEDFLPAEFGKAKNEFETAIKIEDLIISEEIIIKCASRVRQRGQLIVISCYRDEHTNALALELENRIKEAARGLRISPAAVNGDRVQIWYNFTVVFTPTPDGNLIEVIGNHLFNEAVLGRDYIAAQRFDYPVFRKSGCTMPSSGIFVVVSVDSVGRITDIGTTDDGTHADCADRSMRNILDGKFIPAHKDGMPVESVYVEIFF